jgi:pyruvate kinase
MMASIAESTERNLPYDDWQRRSRQMIAESVTEAISLAVTEIAYELNAAAIVATTSSGTTARAVARHRPHAPVIGATPDIRTLHQLALVWGVHPFLVDLSGTSEQMVAQAIEAAQTLGFAKEGDLLVMTAGLPVGIPGHTNMLQVRRVGEHDV